MSYRCTVIKRFQRLGSAIITYTGSLSPDTTFSLSVNTKSKIVALSIWRNGQRVTPTRSERHRCLHAALAYDERICKSVRDAARGGRREPKSF